MSSPHLDGRRDKTAPARAKPLAASPARSAVPKSSPAPAIQNKKPLATSRSSRPSANDARSRLAYCSSLGERVQPTADVGVVNRSFQRHTASAIWRPDRAVRYPASRDGRGAGNPTSCARAAPATPTA
ncbi:hypothetical protein PR003_g7494 [Phytophthora rubi]|uniref:Uncharacterized protein n=1 Tax=Phytophthora rubi TaxID=129364 RepID=A0A6A4FXX2_9STRA|nr:hypothetical protein PR003_g7494 [Phytophthora rubi]